MDAARATAHVLVVAAGTAGDMYPFLHLARTLRGRGHRVTLVGLQAHARAAAAADVSFIGLGTEAEYLALLDHPDAWHPRRGFQVLWRGIAAGLELLPGVLAGLPPDDDCVLLAHPLALPGAALAQSRRPGLRIVAAWLAPSNLRTLHDPLLLGPLRIPRWLPHAARRWLWARVDAGMVDPVALPDLDAARARHGLAPVPHFLAHLQDLPDAHLALFPPWFAPTPPDWPQPLAEGRFALYDPFLAADAALPSELERFLAHGDAPVVFTPGSGNRQAARWLARAVGAARRLGRRAVLLTPHRGQVPAALPADVLWLPYVPLRALLPRAAALVHHGGIGTTAEALRAGVPQLIVPMAYDQFDNAARVEALHAGRALAGWRARPRGLAAALAGLLGSADIRAGCARAARLAAADVAADTDGATLRTLERLLGLE
jgi:rhamnosyltransferase subunit B